MMDNLSLHKSQDVIDRMNVLGLLYSWTPVYSPAYNGCEEVINIGILGGIAGVIAAPFVLATCVMGAGPLIVMGLPVMGAALAINEIENEICKGL